MIKMNLMFLLTVLLFVSSENVLMADDNQQEAKGKLRKTLESNMARLKSGYFPVTMKRKGGNLALFKEAGVTSRISVYKPQKENIETYRKDQIPLYVYTTDGYGPLHLKGYNQLFRNPFLKDRSLTHLIRNPSLSDKKVKDELIANIRNYSKQYKEVDILAMCVAHESSVTSFSSPLDFDFSKSNIVQFRLWLEKKYKTISPLNKSWQKNYKNFDEVTPPVLDVLIDREYKNYPKMRLAQWFDFREYTDDTFVDLIHSLADVVRTEAPWIPTSATVTAVPCAYGGWDYARLLSEGKIDVLETYKFPGDKGLVRGLTNGKSVNFSSLYFKEGSKARLQIWHDFLEGERGCFLGAPGHKIFPSKDKLGGYALEYKDDFHELNSLASKLAGTKIYHGSVSMIYSQPSVRSYWFIDNMPDEKTYPKRGASWEIKHNTYIQGLGGWQQFLGEFGIHPLFESYLDLRHKKFRHGAPKTLIANQMISAGDAEIQFLKEYVEKGGHLILDESFALFDANGNPRESNLIPIINQPRGKLRASFGEVKIKNDASAKPVELKLGKGTVVLLKSTLIRYHKNNSVAIKLNLKESLKSYLVDDAFPVKFELKDAIGKDLFFYQKNKKLAYMGVINTDKGVAGNFSFSSTFKFSDMSSLELKPANRKFSVKIPKNKAKLWQIK